MSKWEIVNNNMLVNGDFKNDAALLLSGDWNSEGEMRNFLTDVCNKLNHYAELEQEREEWKGTALSLKRELNDKVDGLIAYQNMVSTLRDENATLRDEVDMLTMKLTACGVAALANTVESAQDKKLPNDSPYYSTYYEDVYNAVQREIALRAENAKLREKLEYFSDKNTEYLNELWELKKKNALLEVRHRNTLPRQNREAGGGGVRKLYQCVKSCLRKKRYPSAEMASLVMKQAQSKTGDALRVYWCSACSGFHLTHKEV